MQNIRTCVTRQHKATTAVAVLECAQSVSTYAISSMGAHPCSRNFPQIDSSKLFCVRWVNLVGIHRSRHGRLLCSSLRIRPSSECEKQVVASNWEQRRRWNHGKCGGCAVECSSSSRLKFQSMVRCVDGNGENIDGSGTAYGVVSPPVFGWLHNIKWKYECSHRAAALKICALQFRSSLVVGEKESAASSAADHTRKWPRISSSVSGGKAEQLTTT